MDIQSMIQPIINVEDALVPSSEDGWLPMDPDGLAFVNPLWTSPEWGGWVVLFHWEKGFVAPAHKHLGAIHAYIVKGKLQVRDTELNKGDCKKQYIF